MKTRMLLLITAICTLSFSYAQEKLAIDTSKSELKWFGEYTFYFGGHNGAINFKNGHFIKTGDIITGGEFTIDMNSITCDDIKTADANESLVNHLKDPDFFDVAKFPEAKLKITNVTYHDPTHMKIFANLTIKGITLPIEFQAEVDFAKEQMTTRFKIDRMRWGINYNSKLRDGAISDAIGFEVTLNLKKLNE
ncbi:YceI family protein [Psychroserpens luteolus]|uniref:YceI family protein n=1 Tax=Psychroserpens luteolus TaxID=2855840 RepID=UPI001E2A01A9|nr:YceI family protein [Psychroserpens luteolus]MCD2258803.1 YceI family protein [Psychroserpens luteolus]